MKNVWLVSVVTLFASVALAAVQDGNPPGLTLKSKHYRDYRLQNTEPTYHRAKLEKLLAHLKEDEDGAKLMPAKQFDRLSTKEKFTYCMIHGEVFSQNCDLMPGILGEESKIFAQIPGEPGGDEDWSKQQKSFLRGHRGTVIGLLRQQIRAKHRVGLNLKNTILELEAYELIPDMLAVFNRDHKDLDIITTCNLLMKAGDYKPFVTSPIYKKLYADEEHSYRSFVMATPQTERLETRQALAYYHFRTH